MANVNTYETLFILDSNLYARDPGGVSKQIEDIVTQHGGEVLVNRLWMEQKLAYPIKHHQKGTYWLTYFSMPGPELTKMDRSIQLTEAVIRHMSIKLDERLVEPILSHARGESMPIPVLSAAADDSDEDDVEIDDDAEVAGV